LRPEEPTGLVLLPDPAPGDLFFDLEGDAFVGGDGLEYLFGIYEPAVVEDYFGPPEVVSPEQYLSFWATTLSEERAAFESVVDHIVDRRKRFPKLRVYHFGHRENTSSLKELEDLYGFKRTPTQEAKAAMQHFGWWLETGEAVLSPADLRTTIERYNEEDCRSTWALREWLTGQRRRTGSTTGPSICRPKSASRIGQCSGIWCSSKRVPLLESRDPWSTSSRSRRRSTASRLATSRSIRRP
jgi:uncharacterized protein